MLNIRAISAPASRLVGAQQSHFSVEGEFKVSIVMPALNEAENLPYVLPRIPSWIHELILVPGHSTDNTVEVARKLWPAIRIIGQEGRGKGAALRAGFVSASGDIVVTLDADGSMDPGEIPAFIDALLNGADFAKGSRFMPGGGSNDFEFHRRLGNLGISMTARRLFGGRCSDLLYGYTAFWTHILPKLQLDCDGFEIEAVMLIGAMQTGLKVVEVPSFEARRVHGVSHLNTFKDGWRVMKTLLSAAGKRRADR